MYEEDLEEETDDLIEVGPVSALETLSMTVHCQREREKGGGTDQ